MHIYWPMNSIYCFKMSFLLAVGFGFFQRGVIQTVMCKTCLSNSILLSKELWYMVPFECIIYKYVIFSWCSHRCSQISLLYLFSSKTSNKIKIMKFLLNDLLSFCPKVVFLSGGCWGEVFHMLMFKSALREWPLNGGRFIEMIIQEWFSVQFNDLWIMHWKPN